MSETKGQIAVEDKWSEVIHLLLSFVTRMSVTSQFSGLSLVLFTAYSKASLQPQCISEIKPIFQGQDDEIFTLPGKSETSKNTVGLIFQQLTAENIQSLD